MRWPPSIPGSDRTAATRAGASMSDQQAAVTVARMAMTFMSQDDRCSPLEPLLGEPLGPRFQLQDSPPFAHSLSLWAWFRETWRRMPTPGESPRSGMTRPRPSRRRRWRSPPSAGCGPCCHSTRVGMPRGPIQRSHLSRCTARGRLRWSNLAKRPPSHSATTSISGDCLRCDRDHVKRRIALTAVVTPAGPLLLGLRTTGSLAYSIH